MSQNRVKVPTTIIQSFGVREFPVRPYAMAYRRMNRLVPDTTPQTWALGITETVNLHFDHRLD